MKKEVTIYACDRCGCEYDLCPKCTVEIVKQWLEAVEK